MAGATMYLTRTLGAIPLRVGRPAVDRNDHLPQDSSQSPIVTCVLTMESRLRELTTKRCPDLEPLRVDPSSGLFR